MKPQSRPTHKHAHALSIRDDNKKPHKVRQVCYGKKKQRRIPRPLHEENARQKGMLSKTLRKKKEKKRETQGTTHKNKQPTPQRPARALFLQGEKAMWDK